MGYCLNKGGIVLNFSEMRGCHVECRKMTVDIEGGLIWKDVYYKYLKDKRNIVIGGLCPTVRVGGFTLGAGLSPFPRSYSLGYDNLLRITCLSGCRCHWYHGCQQYQRPQVPFPLGSH
jgi:FAD/FMN-containing dehydrogenase